MTSIRQTSYVAAATLPLLVALAMTTAVGANDDPQADTATYSVVFVPSWNPTSHPLEYPLTHAKQGPAHTNHWRHARRRLSAVCRRDEAECRAREALRDRDAHAPRSRNPPGHQGR